jgi:hypothetical protein
MSTNADYLLSDSIKLILDISQPLDGARKFDGLDRSHRSLKQHREKADFLLDDGESIHCGVCKRKLCLEEELIVVCPHGLCRCACHIGCLAARFLDFEGASQQLIPTTGDCPACHSSIEWPTLMREVTLRIRGTQTKQHAKTGAVSKRQDHLDPEIEDESDQDHESDSCLPWDEGEWPDDGSAVNALSNGIGNLELEVARPKLKPKGRITSNKAGGTQVERRITDDWDNDSVIEVI